MATPPAYWYLPFHTSTPAHLHTCTPTQILIQYFISMRVYVSVYIHMFVCDWCNCVPQDKTHLDTTRWLLTADCWLLATQQLAIVKQTKHTHAKTYMLTANQCRQSSQQVELSPSLVPSRSVAFSSRCWFYFDTLHQLISSMNSIICANWLTD